MIKQVKVQSVVGKVNCETQLKNNMLIINCSKMIETTYHFTIEIVFSETISAFRNHNYEWTTVNENLIANSFSPKIIKLSNGFYIQANTNQGIWEVQKKHPTTLFWRFNPEHSNPLAKYSHPNNQKTIAIANPSFDNFITPALLFSEKGAVELSRSKIPFVATACFTDHCDFDTVASLKKQREFFKKNSIILTKGFFLNHFSKRADNASWENDKVELQNWVADGHELCYHSLSQSIKNKDESNSDFFNFSPPLSITTWIDHGYQPYNLSLYQKEGMEETTFASNLSDKNITLLWNYIDSGTATSGVLNQMNPNNFTLQSFYKGIKNKSFKKRISLLIKNCIVHFYADEKLIKKYTQLASSFKKVMISKSVKALFSFVGNCFSVSVPLLKLVLFWHRFKSKTYPLANYQTLLFEHTIGDKKFIIFQTLEFLDFVTALEKKSVDNFVNEKGMFVGHTYFSVPMEYHDGRIFTNSGDVSPLVAENFQYLGQLIKRNKIWNPTVKDLVAFWQDFMKVEFEISENGAIIIKNQTTVPHRNIT